MNWTEVETLIEQTKTFQAEPHLQEKQIGSNGRLDPYYNFLRLLAGSVKEPGIILEIGCFQGTTPANVCQDFAIHGHKFLGVDLNGVPFEHESFTLIQGDSTSEEVFAKVKEFAEAHGGIIAVFQDSSHHYIPSVKEFELYRPLVNAGGMWLSDDVLDSFKTPEDEKSMLGYWNDLPGDKRLFEDLHIGSTIGMILC